MEVPNSAHIVLGLGCYSLQLWWESPPWFTQVVPAGSFSGKGGPRVGEENGGSQCVVCCGSQREKVEQLRSQMGVQDVSHAGGNPPTLSVEVSGEETDERARVGGSVDLVGGGREPSSNSLNVLGFGSEGLCCGPNVLSGVGFGSVGVDAKGEGAFYGDEAPVSLPRARSEQSISKVRGASGGDDPLVGYVDPRSFPMRGRELSSSTSSVFGRVVLNEGSLDGLAFVVNGEEQIPLRIILADGSNGELVSKGEKSVVGEGVGGEFEGLLQDMEGKGCRWDNSCLARFSKFLGFPTESFEGANDRNKRKVIKALIRSQKVDVVCLQETKIQDMSQGVVHSLGVGRFLGWGAVSAKGQLVGWYGSGSLLNFVSFKNCEDGFLWIFTGVYGPTLKRYREPFWEELGAIRGLWSDLWCIGGDFNVIRFPSERSREGRLSGSMGRFTEVIDELALRDLSVQGGPFTWSGGLNGQSRSRLDRFLISEDRENHFRGVSQCTLPRPVFDHFPILLDGDDVRRGPIPFCFENMWLKEEGFKELLKGEKLKALKIKLKNWNKEVFGKVGVNMRVALDKVSFWDDQERQRVLNDLEFDSIGVEEAARLEEMFSVEEVFLALSELNGDKAPGPDGFPLAFWHLKTTFLVLVPKKGEVDDLCDFRPIGLVGSLYKLLAKVLANRLKKVVSKVVSPTQNAFVDGRQVLDATLIANEAIDSMLKRDEFGVLYFLLTVMQKMGFGEKWAGWIRWCISIASFSVLINGSPSGFFQNTKGMEALSCLINKAVRRVFLTGCRIRGRSGSGIQVSHLLFADDTSVFCEDSQEQMAFLIWDGVEERMWKRLTLWKRQFISKGGRITLIRSTLVSMPIYLMSLLRMPRVVRMRLEKIQRDFLWGGGVLEKRPHLVKWVVVCSYKKKGGLGIRNLSILNRALLCKWSWRFAVERESFWKLIISRKEGYGVGFWKEIRKEDSLLLKNVSFAVGDGRRWIVGILWEMWGLDSLGLLLVWRIVLWKASKNGIFSVKSLYNTLESSCAVSFLWSIIWSPYVPTKVGFFAWEASWGKVLTQDQLEKRGCILANKCVLCCAEEETINHILIHCPKARVLWDLVFSLFGVNWVLSFTVRDTLSGWSASFVDKKRGKTWRAAPLCLFWTVWKERNMIVFDNEVLSILRMKNSFVYGGPCSLINFVDWLGSS
ncbi:hypothetical protein AAG906_011508 [Vitis piasezkii]